MTTQPTPVKKVPIHLQVNMNEFNVCISLEIDYQKNTLKKRRITANGNWYRVDRKSILNVPVRTVATGCCKLNCVYEFVRIFKWIRCVVCHNECDNIVLKRKKKWEAFIAQPPRWCDNNILLTAATHNCDHSINTNYELHNRHTVNLFRLSSWLVRLSVVPIRSNKLPYILVSHVPHTIAQIFVQQWHDTSTHAFISNNNSIGA